MKENKKRLLVNNLWSLVFLIKIINLPSVYSLTHSLICPHNALVSHLKLVPGCRDCFIIQSVQILNDGQMSE